MPKRPCIFCEIANDRAEASLIYEDQQLLVFMDIHPLGNGHVLVIPREHVVHTRELDEATRALIWEMGHKVAIALRSSSIPCDGHHYLMNDGRAANQSVMHAHLHVIPRKRGDTLRTPFRIIGHALGMISPIPISQRKRQRLNEQAIELKQALAAL